MATTPTYAIMPEPVGFKPPVGYGPMVGFSPRLGADPSWYANGYNIAEVFDFMTAVWRYTYSGNPLTEAMLAQGAKYGYTVASAQAYLDANTTYQEAAPANAGTTTYSAPTTGGGYPVGYGWVKIPADPLTGRAESYIYTIVDANGNPTSGSATTQYTFVCTLETFTIEYPEQPYIPPHAEVAGVASQTIIDLNLGWNAGARSKYFFTGGGIATFRVMPTLIGAVVGLNDAGVDPGYTNIDHAWYFSHGIARIYEDGVEKFYAGTYDGTEVFAVRRLRGIVTYLKDGVTIYTSERLNHAPLFLDASLYSGDDAVYDPIMSDLGYSETRLEPLACIAYGGGATPFSFSNTSLLPLTVSSRVANRSETTLEALDGLGADHIYGQSKARFLPLEVSAQGGMPMPAFSIANVAMLYLTGGASGLTGEIGGGDVMLEGIDGLASGSVPTYIGSGTGNVTVVGGTITVVVVNGDGTTTTVVIDTVAGTATTTVTNTSTSAVISTVTGTVVNTVTGGGTTTYTIHNTDGTITTVAVTGSNGTITIIHPHAYGESVTVMHPLLGAAYAYEGALNATMLTITGAFGEITAPLERFVVMNSSMTMATYIIVGKVADANATSTTTMLSSMEVQATLEAVMQSLVMMSFGVPVFDGANDTWVVNANTGASSRYEDFPFTGYGKIGAHYYGCKANGLHILEGETDNTLPIRASVDFGNSNFGTSSLKGCTNAYIGVSSTGNMYLKTTVDGEEYIYVARNNSENMSTRRVDMGRGIRANYLKFELYNNEGCDFELDSVEFLVVPMSRRI